MKTMKKIFLAVLVLALAIVFVGCKQNSNNSNDSSSYIYPSAIPMISDTDSNFLKINDFVVSNKKAYVSLVNQYGLEILRDWADELLLSNISLDGFAAYYDEIIYGTKELSEAEREEALADFNENCLELGLFTDTDKENYYKLQYKRLQVALSKLEEAITSYDELTNKIHEVTLPAQITEDLTLYAGDDNYKVEYATTSKYLTISSNVIKVTRGAYDEETTVVMSVTKDDLTVKGTFNVTVLAKDATVTNSEKVSATVDPYYTESEANAQYDISFNPDAKVILVTFNSYNEASLLLKKLAIEVDPVNQTWTKNGVALDKEGVKNAFKDLKRATTNSTDYYTNYEYNTLTSVSSNLTQTIYGLKAASDAEAEANECYTLVPVVYGSKVYFVYVEERAEKVSFDEKKAEIYDELTRQAATNEYVIFANILKETEAGLEIYDEGLENRYVNAIANLTNYASLIDYERTSNTSNTIVAKMKVNGVEQSLSAEVFFNKLKARYGAIVAEKYLEQYVVMSKSTVIDVITGSAKENQQEAYDEAYETDVTTYKTRLESGTYASSGYAANYGWDNFLRDNLGVLSEKDLMIRSASTLYKAALETYKESLVGTHEEILADAKAIWDDFFSVSEFTVSTYMDANHDLVNDEATEEGLEAGHRLLEIAISLVNFAKHEFTYADDYFSNLVTNYDSDKALLIEQEVKEIISLLNQLEKPVDMYNKVLSVYNLAPIDDALFGEFKVAGVVMVVSSDSSLTSSSASVSEAIASLAKEVYDRLETEGLIGNSYSPYYEYTETVGEGDEKTEVQHVYIPRAEEIFFDTDRYSTIVVTRTTKRTQTANNTKGWEEVAEVLTEENYQKYVDNDSSLTSTLKSVISFYYVAARSAMMENYNDQIISDAKDLLATTTVDATIKAQMQQLFADK